MPEFPSRSAAFWWRLFLLAAGGAFSLLVILQPVPWKVIDQAGGLDALNLSATVRVFTWWAGIAGMLIMAGLVVLVPWWTGARPAEDRPPPPLPPPRWFWPLTLAAVIACGAVTGPTLTHSLWDDENESVTWYSIGRYVRQGDEGTLRFKQWSWQRTLYGYSTPNNHVFHNILSRASNSVWRSATRPPSIQFNHLAIRLPAFLAALAAVAALAFLLREFGYPGAGVLAACFLALHPWFTEHAAVARGYTMVMLLAILATVAWRRALLSAKWRWWGLFAAAQFFAMWTYPGIVFLLAPLNLAAIILVWRSAPPAAGPARTQLSRWFLCNSLTAAALLPLLLPLLPQLRAYIAGLDRSHIGFPWVRDTFWFFVGGAPWGRPPTGEWKYHNMHLAGETLGYAALWLLLGVVVAPFLLGVWRLARSGPLALAVTVCTLAAPVLQFFYARRQQIHIWEWYVIFALPFVAMFWGLGAATIAGWAGRLPRGAWLGPAAAAVLLAVWILTTQPVRAWQAAHPKTPHFESALMTRSDLQDHQSEANRRIMTFSVANASWAYDPALFIVSTPAELVLLCRQADQSGRALIGSIGHIHLMQLHHQRELQLLEDPALFGTRRFFGGAAKGWDRFVYVYTPGSAATYDFEGILSPEEIEFIEKNLNLSPDAVFSQTSKN
jgi:hypothetical protein